MPVFSMMYNIVYDATSRAEWLYQPLLLVAGSEAGSLWQSKEILDKAGSMNKELALIDGANHMSLYDDDKYVDQAVEKLAGFFTGSLN